MSITMLLDYLTMTTMSIVITPTTLIIFTKKITYCTLCQNRLRIWSKSSVIWIATQNYFHLCILCFHYAHLSQTSYMFIMQIIKGNLVHKKTEDKDLKGFDENKMKRRNKQPFMLIRLVNLIFVVISGIWILCCLSPKSWLVEYCIYSIYITFVFQL